MQLRLHMRHLTGLWLLPALLTLSACSSPQPRRDPLGEPFPTVEGQSLDGSSIELPGSLDGKPAILLVGYVMEAQFDIDRWLLGLMQLETPIQRLELPTIDGMLPGLFAGTIDNGMRSGIPPEDWAAVVTLYGDDAERVVQLTGDEGGRNARVLLLDGGGRVVWFADRGWSAGQLVELDARSRELVGPLAQDGPTEEANVTSHNDLLFDFSDPTAVDRFGAIDDRVMGGVSQSRLRTAGGTAVFEGDLSTEQNGGFASVRSADAPIDLSKSTGLALHVRGDGRTYKLRMRTDGGFEGLSYQASFATTADAWMTLQLPFELFRPTFRGELQPDAAPLDPSAVVSFGLLVADGQVGRFRLEMGWIRAFGQR